MISASWNTRRCLLRIRTASISMTRWSPRRVFATSSDMWQPDSRQPAAIACPCPYRRLSRNTGNMLQVSFFHAAAEKAQAAGLPLPDADEYRYPWHIPTSKESGIVMLADSLEAAMRSTRTDTIEGTEQLARKIV